MDENILKEEESIWTILSRYFYKMFSFFIEKKFAKKSRKCFNCSWEDLLHRKRNIDSYSHTYKLYRNNKILRFLFEKTSKNSFGECKVFYPWKDIDWEGKSLCKSLGGIH